MSEILKNHYDNRNEDERLLSRVGNVEFIVSTTYIDRYLKEGDKILEIGAGTGRYSIFYADKGYDITAIELVKSNLDILKSKIKPTHNIRAHQGNALDLSAFSDNSFDVTLLFGPMYHLYTTEDKLKALSEAIRVTKKSGLIFVAYIQFDAAMIQTGFMNSMFDYLIELNAFDKEKFLPISNEKAVFELHRKEQINELNSHFNVERLHYIGTDMFAEYYKDKLCEMDERLYNEFIKYTLTICENQNLVGVSNHVLDILKKEG